MKRWSPVLVLGIGMWLAATINALLSEFFLVRYLGDYLSHAYRHLAVVPLYYFVAYHYIRMSTLAGMRLAPGLVGGAWLVMFALGDYLFWNTLYGVSASELWNDCKIWTGRLYLVNLAALAAAPALMKRRATAGEDADFTGE